MRTRTRSKHQTLLVPVLTLVGVIGLFAYAVIAAMSSDPLWFLGGASVPDPERIVVRVDGQEAVLTAASPGYELIVEAAREALSRFDNLSPRSAGLSETPASSLSLS